AFRLKPTTPPSGVRVVLLMLSSLLQVFCAPGRRAPPRRASAPAAPATPDPGCRADSPAQRRAVRARHALPPTAAAFRLKPTTPPSGVRVVLLMLSSHLPAFCAPGRRAPPRRASAPAAPAAPDPGCRADSPAQRRAVQARHALPPTAAAFRLKPTTPAPNLVVHLLIPSYVLQLFRDTECRTHPPRA